MNFISKIFSIIKLVRPWNFFITFFSIIVAVLISSEENFPFWDPEKIKIILFAAVSGSFTASAGYVINDYFDLKIDLINRPHRPLPSGALKQSEALVIYLILLAAGLFLAGLINIFSFLVAFLAANLLFLYSFKLKRVLLLGNFIIAFLTGLAFLYGGIAANNIKSAIFPALLAFLINLSREILKDIEDLEGDKKEGIITFPGKYGIQNSKLVITISTAVLIALTFIPFIINYYKIEFTVIAAVVVNPVLIYFLKSLYENDSLKNLHKFSNILKLEMVFGLAAIYFGK
jgi:geranylgeranylglycerol-phosphate geranylgeranyltransferase